MVRWRRSIVLMLCIAMATSPIEACLWDYDTLAMERQHFPSTLELITGKFLRHSKAFYEWRVADRSKRIAQGESTPELYDDLAVAYDKLDRHVEAISTILQKEKLFPGLYETAANYGTFLIHAGKLEEGIAELDKAIAINPDAHFGREIYQKLVVQYVLEKRNGTSQASSAIDNGIMTPAGGFKAFLAREQKINDSIALKKEATRARKGVEGMMKFGKYDSPVLLEILGELLLVEDSHGNSWLAARAFLKAARSGAKPLMPTSYEQLVDAAIFRKRERGDDDHVPFSKDELASFLDKEVADADAWFQELSANEAKWIATGLDADAEFTAMYYQEPVSISGEPGFPAVRKWLAKRSKFLIPLSAVLVIGVLYGLSKRKRRESTLKEDLGL